LEVEIDVQFARSSARRAFFRSHFREVTQRVEQFVMGGIFLMTLKAEKIWCSHGGTFFPKEIADG
jgi:hypothetical protein